MWSIVFQADIRDRTSERIVYYDDEFKARHDYKILLEHAPTASDIRLMHDGQTILGHSICYR